MWMGPPVLILGTLTGVRVHNASVDDVGLLVGMNRLRAAHLEIDPTLSRYLITSWNDDQVGVLKTYPVGNQRSVISHVVASTSMFMTSPHDRRRNARRPDRGRLGRESSSGVSQRSCRRFGVPGHHARDRPAAFGRTRGRRSLPDPLPDEVDDRRGRNCLVRFTRVKPSPEWVQPWDDSSGPRPPVVFLGIRLIGDGDGAQIVGAAWPVHGRPVTHVGPERNSLNGGTRCGDQTRRPRARRAGLDPYMIKQVGYVDEPTSDLGAASSYGPG